MSRNTRKPERNSGPQILDDNDDTVVTDPSLLENSGEAGDAEHQANEQDADEHIDASGEPEDDAQVDDAQIDADADDVDDDTLNEDEQLSDDERGLDEALEAEAQAIEAAELAPDDEPAPVRLTSDDTRAEEAQPDESTDSADETEGAGDDDAPAEDDDGSDAIAAASDDASTTDDDGPAQAELPNIEPPLDPVDLELMANACEAIIFAAGDPVQNSDIKAVLERSYGSDTARVRKHKLEHFRDAMKILRERWAEHGEARGFGLFEVAEGLTFRSNPRYADYLRETREQRPVRLSRPALETLAIIAYRQPVTKPEVDHIRGVDCGGTIRILLDRDLVRIVGKREEPGRPMLYGTTREFLSFFNLPSLGQLPSLREFSELSEESQEEIKEKLGPSLDDLSRKAKKLRLDEEPAVAALDEAVVELDSTENKTRDAFAAQGIAIDPAVEGPPEQTGPDNDAKAGDS